MAKTNTKNRPKKGKLGYMPFYLILFFGCLIIFYPSYSFDFVNWDDFQNLVENPDVLEFNWNSIKNIFSQPIIANYNPLPIFTFSIEHHLFGMNPGVFHFNNVLLHALCSISVFWLIKKIGLSNNIAGLSALLFAFHPMRVESVAWITERKDVLFALFFFLSAGYYFIYREAKEKKKLYYLISILFFVLSLLSKIQAVSLPLALLTIEYLKTKQWTLSMIWDKIPFFIGALITGLLGVYLLDQGESLDATETFSFFERVILGGYSYLVYLYKFFFPYPMSPLYPYQAELSWTHYAGFATSLVLILALIWQRNNKKLHFLIFGMLFFTVNIMFLLQIVGAGQGFLADRFSYVPYLGLFISASYYLEKYLLKKQSGQTLYYGVSAIIIFLCLFGLQRQLPVWKDGNALWTHVLKFYPNSTTAYNNRAQWNRNNGRTELSIGDYERSIAVNAKQHEVYIGRGKMYFDEGKIDAAIKDFNTGLSIEPENEELLVNRGVALAAKNQLNAALKDFNKALEINPKFLNGYANRSLLYFRTENYEKALFDYDQYLSINPTEPDVWYERGLALRNLNRDKEALESFNQAIQRSPKQYVYYQERAKTLEALGKTQQANQDKRMMSQLK